jgi:hypothetical protein
MENRESGDAETLGPYASMGLKGDPFRVVPDEEFARIWADRSALRRDVDALLRSFQRPGPSAIHLVWGWYGAGKTHVLLHLEGRCRRDGKSVASAYTEMPSSADGFLDLYRDFATTLLGSNPQLGRIFDEVWAARFSRNRQAFIRAVCPGIPDFLVAMNYLSAGLESHKEVAAKYLAGIRLPLNELRTLGISSRIETDDQAVEGVAALVRLVSQDRHGGRVVWFLDELQNLTQLSSRAKAKVQGGIERVFNKCPNNLSLVLAYSGRQQDRISNLVSSAFISRIGAQRRIAIPLMEKTDAVAFVADLLQAFRSNTTEGTADFSPFDRQTVEEVIGYMETQGWHLKPRTIMECFRSILEEAEAEAASGQRVAVDLHLAKEVLQRLAENPGIVDSLTRID